MSSSEPSPYISAGQVIAGFSVLRELGAGGMGEVWEAEQHEPIRRKVALKFLRAGFDTRDFLVRFEAERQALAVMEHPNIARVIEAGVTGTGRPYYVMELVMGVPLTDYCDAHALTTRQRLTLMIAVCRAVQHAHQKGVIHRDLKPTNVLVADGDEGPVPKVIDFGIAKAIGERLTVETLVTEVGAPVGTPAYMSPEQWDAGHVDIDTRTDVYSLGVMLYELLTGRLPHPIAMMMRAGPGISQLLRDTPPPTPSARLLLLGDESTVVARQRNTDPRTLARELSGDLDWITLRAMEADRDRRYETANDLAQDILRHLASEPVLARPPERWYRASRFVRRNRAAVAAASVLMVGLGAFSVLTVLQSKRVASERDRARQEAERATALNDFLERTLLSPDPIDGSGKDITMVQALDSAVVRLQREPPRLPAVEASVASAIGWAYYKLTRFDSAEPLLRRALQLRRDSLPNDSTGLAESYLRLGALLEGRGQHDTAAHHFSTSISLMRAGAGPDHASLALALIGASDLLLARGDTAAAERGYLEARGLYERSADSLGLSEVDDHLGTFAYERGDLASAERLLRRSVAYRRRALGVHPKVANALQNLAVTLEALERPLAAESAYVDALAMAESKVGESDLLTSILSNYGDLLRVLRRDREAESLLRRALAIDEKLLGRDNPLVAPDLVNLALLLCVSGRAREGIPYARRAVGIFVADAGEESWRTGAGRAALGRCLRSAGQYSEAERESSRALKLLIAGLGEKDSRVTDVRAELADLHKAWPKPRGGGR